MDEMQMQQPKSKPDSAHDEISIETIYRALARNSFWRAKRDF